MNLHKNDNTSTEDIEKIQCLRIWLEDPHQDGGGRGRRATAQTGKQRKSTTSYHGPLPLMSSSRSLEFGEGLAMSRVAGQVDRAS